MNLCQRRQTTDADMSDDLRKRQLRRDAIARRKTVTRQERDAAAAALAEHIVPLLDLVGVQAGTSGVMSAPHGRGHRPPTVAAYVSMGSEIPIAAAAVPAARPRAARPCAALGLRSGRGMGSAARHGLIAWRDLRGNRHGTTAG